MKLKINGNGFKDLENPNIWYGNENPDALRWIAEGNIPEPEFTKEELQITSINKQIQEAKTYLTSTAWYVERLNDPSSDKAIPEEVLTKRVEARELINTLEAELTTIGGN